MKRARQFAPTPNAEGLLGQLLARRKGIDLSGKERGLLIIPFEDVCALCTLAIAYCS